MLQMQRNEERVKIFDKFFCKMLRHGGKNEK